MPDGPENLLNDHGRELHRGFLAYEQHRPRHQAATDCNHLLLAV